LRTTFDASSDGKDFFIFFSRNPLKSPDSTKENQGDPSLFAWFYSVLFGFICSEFARWLNRSAGRGPWQAVFTAVGWDISCHRGQEVLQEAVETAQKKPEATVTPQRSKRLLSVREGSHLSRLLACPIHAVARTLCLESGKTWRDFF
jgi:hypothetical protein